MYRLLPALLLAGCASVTPAKAPLVEVSGVAPRGTPVSVVVIPQDPVRLVRVEDGTEIPMQFHDGRIWWLLGKDLDGKRKHVNGTYTAQPILTLNARRYWVVVKYGQVTHEFELDVKPGESRQVQVALR